VPVGEVVLRAADRGHRDDERNDAHD
jgi:hypothetical protein